MPRVIIKHLSGPRIGNTDEFDTVSRPEITVGRDLTSDVRYSDTAETVSRDHLRIIANPSGPFTVIARGRNGTLINGSEIPSEYTIKHGDVVQVGRGGPTFRFEQDPPPSAGPAQTGYAPAYTAQPELAKAPTGGWGAPAARAPGTERPRTFEPAPQPAVAQRQPLPESVSAPPAPTTSRVVLVLLALMLLGINAGFLWYTVGTQPKLGVPGNSASAASAPAAPDADN